MNTGLEEAHKLKTDHAVAIAVLNEKMNTTQDKIKEMLELQRDRSAEIDEKISSMREEIMSEIKKVSAEAAKTSNILANTKNLAYGGWFVFLTMAAVVSYVIGVWEKVLKIF